jgi:hypothetical protein
MPELEMTVVAEGLRFPEGPIALPDGSVLLVEIQRRTLSKVLPDGFLQQHVLRGLTRAGEPFAMPACMVVRCVDGRILRIDEYLDPAQASALSQ